mmetsp:Transcript_12057/g.16100  ORF Transcript_12057/g.16100 Transcript_12057/m.16100 type:complete len:86 (+) Transcript_12057:3-260(+)
MRIISSNSSFLLKVKSHDYNMACINFDCNIKVAHRERDTSHMLISVIQQNMTNFVIQSEYLRLSDVKLGDKNTSSSYVSQKVVSR